MRDPNTSGRAVELGRGAGMLSVNCPLSWEMLGAWVDGEAKHFGSVAPWSHIAECPACTEACAQIRDLGRVFREGAPYYEAPPDLRHTVNMMARRG